MKFTVPFAEEKRSTEFGRALLKKMTRRVSELREEFIQPENVANMPHGHGWTIQQQRQEGFASESSEFKVHSAEVSVHKERILSNDLRLVEDFISEMAQGMHDQFMKSLLQEVDETCTRFNRVTNVPKGSSLADGILTGLADTHASVDANGNVSLPQLMLNPELFERFKTEVAIGGEELEQRAAKIRAQAEKDARSREAERLAKYERQ